jgi:hypothetical protein
MEAVINKREYIKNDEAFRLIEKEELPKTSGGVLDFLF